MKILRLILALSCAIPAFAQKEALQRAVGANTVTGSLASTPFQIATIAALKATTVTSVANGTQVYITGYYAAGDGGQGYFVYSSASAVADNGGTVIAPNAGSGRWLRAVAGSRYSVKWFGAKGDGVTNDSSTCIATITAAGAASAAVYFPAGSYLVSRQGNYAVTGYGAGSIPYAFLVTTAISVYGDGPDRTKFLIPMDTGNNTNLFVFSAVQDVVVSGLSGERSSATNGTTLYGGALVATDVSSNVVVENCTTSNLRGCVIFFGSQDCRAVNCLAEKITGIYSGTHFGSYSSQRIEFVRCTVFGGSNDGDFVHFGGNGADNSFTECRAMNYQRTDATKTIASTGAQGIIFDSGQTRGKAVGCFAYGYYYGYDIKTSCDRITISNCFAYKNKVAIAVRRGEGNSPTLNTSILGCTLVPDGGNGEATALLDGFAILGIFLQDAYGTLIEGNTIGKTYLDAVATDNFLCLGESRNNGGDASTMGATRVIGNKFVNQVNFGGNNRTNPRKFIYMAGTSKTMLNTEISNNEFKGVLEGDITYDFLTLSQMTGLTMTGNTFNQFAFGATGSTGAAIRITNVDRALISGNNWLSHGQALRATTCVGVTLSGNMFRNGVGGVATPTVYLDTVAGFVYSGNNYQLNAGGFTDGRPIDSVNTPAVANYILTSNIIYQTNFNSTNWYRIDGVNIPVRADVIVANNILP